MKSDAQKFHELICLELPDNYNAADILNRMRTFCGEKRYNLFMAHLEYIDNGHLEPEDWSGHIDVDLVTNPSAFLRKAIEFLEENK